MLKSLANIVGMVVLIFALTFGTVVLLHRYHNTVDIGMRTLASFIVRNFERLP